MYCWRAQAEEAHETYTKEFESYYTEQYELFFVENQERSKRRAWDRLTSLFKTFEKEMDHASRLKDEERDEIQEEFTRYIEDTIKKQFS